MSKRVLLIRNAYTWDFGGGERFPVLLAKELQKHGYKPLVVSRSSRLLGLASSTKLDKKLGWWWSYQNFSGMRVIFFPVYVLWQLLLFFWYMQLIIRVNPQIVHPQSRDDFIASTLAGRLLGKRVIWTDHADLKYVWQNYSIWYKNPVGSLVYQASKLAHHITLVSFSEKELIEAQLHRQLPSKFEVIHNGVNTTKPVPVKRSLADKDSIIFVATSRLVAAKGIRELVEAFRELDETANVRLWLIGDGQGAGEFKLVAKGNPHTSFYGHQDKPLNYIAAADVFVHPSYHEGFSLSLVEAAMLGKPVIACDVGGNPEIIKDTVNGLLVPARDSKALENAMSKLANDIKLREKYGIAARKTYEKDFEFEKIVTERFIPLYEK